jgi:DNA-binding response OmpR family regulator
MSILLVDDNEDIRELFEAILARHGHHDVVAADSAGHALALLKLGPAAEPQEAIAFDIIFLDIVMPDIDGIELCGRIRADARYQRIPVVMMTALDDTDTIDRAIRLGATDYLTKPLQPNDLLACVRSKLKRNAERDRLEHQHAP